MADRATLRTDSWNAVYNYLQTTNPISTNNIFSAINDKLVETVGYTIVIIHAPSTSQSKEGQSSHPYTKSEVSFLIEIYATSSASVKALADEVTATLLEGRKTFTADRLMKMEMLGDEADSWTEGQKKIHRIEFTLMFRYLQKNG